MLGLLGFKSDLSAVQVRNERAIPGLRQPVRHTLDLVVQTPPFLDQHDTGCFATLFRFTIVTGTLLPIRPFEINIGSHVFPLSEGLEESSLIRKYYSRSCPFASVSEYEVFRRLIWRITAEPHGAAAPF